MARTLNLTPHSRQRRALVLRRTICFSGFSQFSGSSKHPLHLLAVSLGATVITGTPAVCAANASVCVAFDSADAVAIACAAAGVPVVSTRWLTVSALHWRMMSPSMACWTLGSANGEEPRLQPGAEADVLHSLQNAVHHPCAQTPVEKRLTVTAFQQRLTFLRENEAFATKSSKALADLQGLLVTSLQWNNAARLLCCSAGDGSLSELQCRSFIDIMRRLTPSEYLNSAGGGGDSLSQLEASIAGESSSSRHKKADGRW